MSRWKRTAPSASKPAHGHQNKRVAFLSSPVKGLELHRRAVGEAINKLSGWTWTGIEKSGSADCPSLQWCLEEVAKSTVFVGVLGPMYGSCPRRRKLSFSELEYNKAKTAMIPRLMFLSEDDSAEPRQSNFRRRVNDDRLRGATFVSPDGLATSVVIAMHNWLVKSQQRNRRQPSAVMPSQHISLAPGRSAAAVKRCLALKRRMHRDFLSKHYDPVEARRKPSSKFEHLSLIIHSVDNDTYPEPDADGHVGISTWFKVEPYDFYHGGLEVWLANEIGLFDDRGNWDLSEYGEPPRKGTYEKRRLNMVGRIPYSSIVDYDLTGDEYYGEPHIYCRFEHDGTPYEEIVYSTQSDEEKGAFDSDERLDNAKRLKLP
jgi:hypothetical protein